jgi:hypothetical protein
MRKIMKKMFALKTAVIAAALTFVSSQCFGAEAAQFEPGKVWPDNNGVHINAHAGGVLFHDGTYYWFGQHMIRGRLGNAAQVGVSVYSSKDLITWKDDGIALPVSSDPASNITKGCIIERPKVIYNAKTKKFVMWFHLELMVLKGKKYNSALSGVAVSDKVTGPYTFVSSFRPNNADARDQTLFVDDDGKAYHLYSAGGSSTLHISLLSDDYLTPSGTYVKAFPRRYMEAPAICKRKGKYYFIASGTSGWDPNPAKSAVAESIFGPWTELGNPCVGTNRLNGLGPEKTFGGQSTFILPVQGKEDAFIAMFDIWRPGNPIDGLYIWLPIQFTDSGFKVEWIDQWDLSFFDKGSKRSGEQVPGGDSQKVAPQK